MQLELAAPSALINSLVSAIPCRLFTLSLHLSFDTQANGVTPDQVAQL